jgi:glycine/D-amino acid oxidase-like deaminating enzyme
MAGLSHHFVEWSISRTGLLRMAGLAMIGSVPLSPPEPDPPPVSPTALRSGPTRRTSVAVVGAGIVGACVALVLRRAGVSTTLFDPQPPGSGTTSGNAGLISVDSCIPLALPGVLRQLPGWLLDRDGPLALDPAVLASRFGWFWARLRSSRMQRVLQISDALRALHRSALDDYRALLGAEAFARHIRSDGQWHVNARASSSRSEGVTALLRQRQGVSTQVLHGAALHERLAGLAPTVQHGLWLPANAHTPDPAQLAAALVDQFRQAGGVLQAEPVHAIGIASSGELALNTPQGDQAFAQVVIAAGMRAPQLVRGLGVRLPLLAERGYHVQLRPQAGAPPVPVLFKDHGFVLTPMQRGLRLAGKVDLARDHSAPRLDRARAMLEQARKLWPALDADGATFWMGERPCTPDSLPVLGRVESIANLFLACGHGHFGLTGAPMSARLVAAALLGSSPPIDARPYALSRFHRSLH